MTIHELKNKSETFNNLFHVIPQQDWTVIHNRVFNHTGCIVDIGCLTWGWLPAFKHKKRFIGIDPFENPIDGAELFKGCLGPFNGNVFIKYDGQGSNILNNNTDVNASQVDMMCFKSFVNRFNIDEISLLKINIEGSEYPLLHSMDTEDFKKIDQICISFHTFVNPNWKFLTESSLHLLKNMGYEIIETFDRWGWYLAIKK
jgi:hypothetical protein